MMNGTMVEGLPFNTLSTSPVNQDFVGAMVRF